MRVLSIFAVFTLVALLLTGFAHFLTATPETYAGKLRRLAFNRVCRALQSFFRACERVSRQAGDACAICPNCGRNKYKGLPCARPLVRPVGLRGLLRGLWVEFWNDEPLTMPISERTETE